jgi:hypothetical protein
MDPSTTAQRDNHLAPPENDKAFLISPPGSPPLGWEQLTENPPVLSLEPPAMDHHTSLLRALSSKLPGFQSDLPVPSSSFTAPAVHQTLLSFAPRQIECGGSAQDSMPCIVLSDWDRNVDVEVDADTEQTSHRHRIPRTQMPITYHDQ